MNVEKKSLFIVLLSLIILLGIISPLILPQKFYFDSYQIVEDPYDEKGLIGSYPITIFFYWITGLSKLPYSLVALFQLPILFLIIFLIGIPNRFSEISIKNLIMYQSFFMVALFISQPSKEFINFLFIGFIVLIFKNKYLSLGICILISTLLFMFFGAIFRPYYIFMPLITLSIFLITKIRFKNRWILSLILGLCTIILFSFIYKLGKGEFISDIAREDINRVRIESGDENANTIIMSPIPVTNIFTEAFSVFYGFITVNFPINALRFFYKPQVLVFVLWQIFMTWIIIVRFGYLLKEFPKRRKELWLMSLLLAYFIIQGIFEPDLGSAVRHKIGMLPLIYYLFYYDDFTKKNRSIK